MFGKKPETYSEVAEQSSKAYAVLGKVAFAGAVGGAAKLIYDVITGNTHDLVDDIEFVVPLVALGLLNRAWAHTDIIYANELKALENNSQNDPGQQG